MSEIFSDPQRLAPSPTIARSTKPTDIDLSRQIEQMVEREPIDRVRCVRVFGDFYRCNWWSRVGNRRDRNYDWGGLMTDHVRQSRFFKATVSGEDVLLEDVRPG
jgi:hypothetical protein